MNRMPRFFAKVAASLLLPAEKKVPAWKPRGRSPPQAPPRIVRACDYRRWSRSAQGLAFQGDLVHFDTATGQGEIHEQPPTEIAYAYQALRDRHGGLCAQMRFKKVLVALSGALTLPWLPRSPWRRLGRKRPRVSMPGPFSSGQAARATRQLWRRSWHPVHTLPIRMFFEDKTGAGTRVRRPAR